MKWSFWRRWLAEGMWADGHISCRGLGERELWALTKTCMANEFIATMGAILALHVVYLRLSEGVEQGVIVESI